ncbi:MAG: hypothetical protein ABWZ98_12940, partial [Nakamurella sp.]
MPGIRPLPHQLVTLASSQDEVLTGAQLRTQLGPRGLRRAMEERQIILLWHGAYCSPSALIPAVTKSDGLRTPGRV